MTLFDRDLLEEGLRQLVAQLRGSGTRSGIRIVGGAALALRYFERESTVDVDAHFVGSTDIVEQAASAIARANGWPDDWLNTKAAGFIPEYGVKPVKWVTIKSRRRGRHRGSVTRSAAGDEAQGQPARP